MKTRIDWVMKGLLLLVGSGLWASAIAYGTGKVGAAAESESQLVPDVIRTHRLEIVDEKGKVVAELAPSLYGGGSIQLYDSEGKTGGKIRAALALLKDGPGLALYDARGKSRAGLVLSKEELGLFIADAQEMPRVGLALSREGPGLMLFDARGKLRAVLGTVTTVVNKITGLKTTTPESTLTLFDSNENVLFQAP
jgi:hypothetical protein